MFNKDHFNYQVLKYTISTDTIEVVGEMETGEIYGSIVKSPNGTIYYISTRNRGGVYRLDPSTNEIKHLDIPFKFDDHSLVQINSSTAYMVSFKVSILRF